MMGRMGWTLAALTGVGIGHSAPVLGQAGPGGDFDPTSVESTVEALYRSLSFDAGGEPDWSFVRGLFLDEAFVVFQPAVAGQPVGGRGLDCLQLTRVDGRWWIISIITDWEGPNQPIPERISGESAVGSPGEA